VTREVIHIPSQLKGLTLARVVAQLDETTAGGMPDEFVFDFSGLRFIRPAGIVFLSNVMQWLSDAKGARVQLVGLDTSRDAIRFLDNSLFFEQHCGSKLNPESTPRPTTWPLTRVDMQQSHALLQMRMVPWAADTLGCEAGNLASYKTCISELFNNIVDHTRLDIGGIAAQYFPNGDFPFGDCIEVGVADFGLGIPATVRKVEPDVTDAEAIKLAFKEGFSSKSTPRNRGAGLPLLIDYLVGAAGGHVTVFSGNAIVEFRRGPDGRIASRVSSQDSFTPGTLIEITVPANFASQVGDDDEGELEW